MTNTANQEAIRKAWGEIYEKVEKHLTKDGYAPFQLTEMKVIFFENEHLFETTDKIGFNAECIGIEFFRPKSLQGIENNNGWIRIESEKDLPSGDMDVFVLINSKIESDYYLVHHNNFKYFNWHECTHYQPIVKPEKPIY